MTVRVGVVGTSYWTDFLHLPMLSSHPQAAITAICGRTRANAEALAAKYSIPQVFTDYRTMIAAGRFDAVLVATPDDTHLPIVMAAPAPACMCCARSRWRAALPMRVRCMSAPKLLMLTI